MTTTRDFQDNEIMVGRMRMHYMDWGTEGKQPMLLLHGGSQSAHSWDEFSRVSRHDYRVVALDQRGHGDSDWSKSGTYTARAQVQDITRFVNLLGLKKFVLIGLSMGGRNSFMYAAMHPEKVDRLVIVDVGPEIMKKGGRAIQRFQRSADILPTVEAFVERAHKFNPRRAHRAIAGAAVLEPAPAPGRQVDVEVRPALSQPPTAGGLPGGPVALRPPYQGPDPHREGLRKRHPRAGRRQAAPEGHPRQHLDRGAGGRAHGARRRPAGLRRGRS